MKKEIFYVLTNRRGEIAVFYINCTQSFTDAELLEVYGPDKLRGEAKRKLNVFINEGYSLSNWHVIDARNEKCVRVFAK